MNFEPYVTYFDAPSMSRHHLAARLAAIVDRSLVAHWQIFEFAMKSRLCTPKIIMQYFKGTPFFYQESSCHKQIIKELCCGEENS